MTKKKFLMNNELINFLSLCQEMEGDFKESQACILVKVGRSGENLGTRRIYKTINDFRDKAYEYVKNLDPSLQVDFEIYDFD